MRVIFNILSSIQPKKVLILGLLMTGAGVSLVTGQIVLASVFAVAAVGCTATFNRNQKQLRSLHDGFLIEGKPALSRKWFRNIVHRSEKEALENQKPRKVMNELGEIVERTADTKVIFHVTDERFLRPFSVARTKKKALTND